MDGLVSKRPSHYPKAPVSLGALDIPESLVGDLMLRRLYLHGQSTLAALGEALKLSHPVLNAVFQQLRQQQLFEVKGMVGHDYQFTLTGSGRALAAERYAICQYAGPAPVSLSSYTASVRAQRPEVRLNRDVLREELGDLVLTEGLLDKLGPALMAQGSLFLYGPTGNGKTSLAERVFRIFADTVAVPYAVEVDGQIIVQYDPVVHERVDGSFSELDPRWVVCRRPSVKVGGELDTAMLELRMDDVSKVYAAPVQMRANNGVLIIDDFGRQVIEPRYLLNRWIVPLDRKVDYLSLRYGVKFEIPFEMTVVFATNLDPSDLADPAFFRRIQNKIHIGAVGAAQFDEIFHRVVASRGVDIEPGCGEHMRRLCELGTGGELRACHPADLLQIVGAIHAYEGQQGAVSASDLERAASVYFAQDVVLRG